jgi:hypothetical protein
MHKDLPRMLRREGFCQTLTHGLQETCSVRNSTR